MSKVVGKVTRKIFESDNNYMVLLLKIKETDLDIDINKTITITGYFYDLETDLESKITISDIEIEGFGIFPKESLIFNLL